MAEGTTLSDLKAEVASILKRTDLTSEIAQAISHAIAEYQNEGLFFKDTKTATFSCVVGQVYYDSSDDADIPLMNRLDDVQIRISNNDYSMHRIEDIATFERLNDGNVSNGQPFWFVYYAQSIGLYPPPDDTYTITTYGGYDTAEPASDGATGNVWMTKAYRLVLYRTLGWLNEFHIRDYELAGRMNGQAQMELDRLYTRTNRLKSAGRLVPTEF